MLNLVSLMISLALGASITLGAIVWYQGLLKMESQQKKSVNVFDALHSTWQFLLHDIQSSGYRGCLSSEMHFPLNRIVDVRVSPYRYFRFDQAVFGFTQDDSHAACYGKLPKETCEKIKPNSEVLIIYNVAQKIMPLKRRMKSLDEEIHVNGTIDLWTDSLVLLSDCQQGDLFIATKLGENWIYHDRMLEKNISSDLSKIYDSNATLVELQTVAYYLSPSMYSNVKNPKNSNNPKDAKEVQYGLYRKNLVFSADEIVSGIQDLKFYYGFLDEELGKMVYQSSELLNDKQWKKVRTVRVVVNTEEKAEEKKEWMYEIAIRNRVGFNYYNDIVGDGFHSQFNYPKPKSVAVQMVAIHRRTNHETSIC